MIDFEQLLGSIKAACSGVNRAFAQFFVWSIMGDFPIPHGGDAAVGSLTGYMPAKKHVLGGWEGFSAEKMGSRSGNPFKTGQPVG